MLNLFDNNIHIYIYRKIYYVYIVNTFLFSIYIDISVTDDLKKENIYVVRFSFYFVFIKSSSFTEFFSHYGLSVKFGYIFESLRITSEYILSELFLFNLLLIRINVEFYICD